MAISLGILTQHFQTNPLGPFLLLPYLPALCRPSAPWASNPAHRPARWVAGRIASSGWQAEVAKHHVKKKKLDIWVCY